MIDLDKLRESEGYMIAIVNTQTGEYEPVSDDVMQVIRCKDCLFWPPNLRKVSASVLEMTKHAMTVEEAVVRCIHMRAEDYCSKAERKEK